VRKACLICGKGVLNRHYRSHLKTHRTDRARYSCDLCAAQLTRRNDVRRHKSLVHIKERQVQCALCTRFFVKEMFLKRHLNAQGQGGTTTTTSLVCASCRAKKSYVEENRAFDKEDLAQNEMVQTRQSAEDRLAAIGVPLAKARSGESVYGDSMSWVRHKGSSEERLTTSAPTDVNLPEEERNILEVNSIVSEDILMFAHPSSPPDNDKEKVLLEEQDGEDSSKVGMSQVGKKRSFYIPHFFIAIKNCTIFFVVVVWDKMSRLQHASQFTKEKPAISLEKLRFNFSD
jgi:hypothetical protein